MHRYHVVDLEAEDGMCVLQSSASLYHVVRLMGCKPALKQVEFELVPRCAPLLEGDECSQHRNGRRQ